MSTTPDERRRARKAWPIRAVALREEQEEVISNRPASELIAMVHRLTLDAWAMTGESIPSYTRAEMPGRIVRPKS